MAETGQPIVIDMDEVLVNITPKWAVKAYNAGLFTKRPSMQEIFNRKNYYLSSMLSPEKQTEENLKIFNELYFQDSSFYDNLPPTPLCIGLVMNNDLYGSKIIGDIHIVTKVDNDCTAPVNQSKLNWINEIIVSRSKTPERIHVHMVPGHRSKRLVIDSIPDDIAIYAEDSIDNVIDVLTESNEHGKPINIPKSIIMPEMGYVKDFPGLDRIKALAMLSNSNLVTYSNFN